MLWIDPTAQNEAGPTRDQLEPERAEMIDDGMRFDSQEEAARLPPRQRHDNHDDHHHDHDDDDHHDHDDGADDRRAHGLPVITTAATGASGASDGTPTGVTTTAAP